MKNSNLRYSVIGIAAALMMIPSVDGYAQTETVLLPSSPPQQTTVTPVVCSNGLPYDYATNNCHSIANGGVLDGTQTGVYRCSGTVGNQGGHTINWSLGPVVTAGNVDPDETTITFTNNNGGNCQCIVPNSSIADGTPIFQAVMDNSACSACAAKYCNNNVTGGTFLPPGQLDEIPGNGVCVRQTLNGTTSLSALGNFSDPTGSQQATCLSCCNTRMQAIQKWIAGDPVNEQPTETQNANTWFNSCQTLCKGFYQKLQTKVTAPPGP